MAPSISSRLPLAVFLLLAAVALLSYPVAAAAATNNNNYSSGGGVLVAAAAAGAHPPNGRWQRRLEEGVAPAFAAMQDGEGQQYISYNTLNKDRPACGGDGCAARGAAYTRPCYYFDQCRG